MVVCQCLVFEPCLVLHTGGRWTSLRADACCLWSSPSTRALLAVLIRALRIGYPYRPPCLPHVPEAQGSLPIVALLLYARGDGSLTYVPSLSHYRCEQRDQGGTDVQRGPTRDLRPGAGNGRACAQARQEATRTAELLDRSVTQTGRTLSEGPRRTCQVFVGGHNSQFRLCVFTCSRHPFS